MKNGQVKTPKSLSEFEAYTGGDLTRIPHSKTADLAIFYNLAVTNIEKMIGHYEDSHKENSSFPKTTITKILKGEISLQPNTYRLLAEYLWKRHMWTKNKNDHELKPDDEKLIHKLFYALSNIRNYQSHIWHDNAALIIDDEVKIFIERMYDLAFSEVFKDNPHEVLSYEKGVESKGNKFPLFKRHANASFITDEGKIFFLSFFLTTGQMSRFLQQRKGSKRNDLPLFKIKHHVYKYYCHRDGASILGFHQEDSILKSIDNEHRQNILRARHAYKLITYLNDYPEYLADNNTLMLMRSLSDGRSLEKINSVQDLVEFIKVKNLFVGFDFIPIIGMKINQTDNSKEEYEKNRSIGISHADVPDYLFHISFDNLYKLIMLCLKYDEAERTNYLLKKMAALADHRQQLYTILTNGLTHLDDDQQAYLINPANQYLRGYRKLTEKGIVFFEKYLKGKNIPAKQIDDLAEQIRPLWQNGESEPEPIIINSQDFVEKTEQKFRAANRFVYYGAKYLVDYNITPDWYWEVERFTPEKQKQFQKIIDDKNDWRLSIENDHVTIGIPKALIPDEGIKSNERHKYFYQFSIGTRCMRYILAMHFMNPKRSLNDFAAKVLKADFEILTEEHFMDAAQFQLLQKGFVPQYLKQDNGGDTGMLQKRITQRFELIKETWKDALDKKQFLKRAHKNQLIMDCYKFFDWTINEKETKFLRKDEYKYLSVCHYCLNEEPEKIAVKKSKFNHLFFELFQLDKRSPTIPIEVKKILSESLSLDDLLERVIIDRKAHLQECIDLISILPKGKKKNELIKIARQLGVSVPPALLDDEANKQLQTKREKTLDVLPYPIHPIMVLKYYQDSAFNAQFENKNPSTTNNDVFKRLRTRQFTSGLCQEHYDIAFLDNLLPSMTEPVAMQICRKQKEKWIGAINIIQTEDVLLWLIAKEYLQSNPYTRNMATILKRSGNDLEVGNLYNADVVIDLKKGEGKDNKDDEISYPIKMSLKMHQIDDVMFATDRDRLRRAAVHYRRRHNEEKEFWETLPEYVQSENGESSGYKYANDSGQESNPIPYQVLREELQLIAQHGMFLAHYLLEWEREVLVARTKGFTTDADRQFFLQNDKPKEGLAFVDFDQIIKFSKDLAANEEVNVDKYSVDIKELKTYRKRTFHSGIPVTGSFAWKARPQSPMGRLFNIFEAFHWPKDTSRYTA